MNATINTTSLYGPEGGGGGGGVQRDSAPFEGADLQTEGADDESEASPAGLTAREKPRRKL